MNAPPGGRLDACPGISERTSRDSCVLCDVLDGCDQTPARSFLTRSELPTETLASGASITAIADVAPLAPGHVLLVTTRHVLAMSKLTSAGLTELRYMRERFARWLESLYSLPVISFEHGLCTSEGVASCGIDHAHLHLLPTNIPVEDKFRADFDVMTLRWLSDLEPATRQVDEHLFLQGSGGIMLLARPQHPASQYFRRVISGLGGRQLWNWNDEVLLGQAAQRREWILDLHQAWGGRDLMPGLFRRHADEMPYAR